jgi:hypothetical protein
MGPALQKVVDFEIRRSGTSPQTISDATILKMDGETNFALVKGRARAQEPKNMRTGTIRKGKCDLREQIWIATQGSGL